MTQMKTIKVFETSDLNAPAKPVEFMAFWQGIIDSIPEEFRDSARIEIDTEWDSAIVEVNVEYTRPMTEKELVQSAKRSESIAEMTRIHELRTLNHLKAKYEGETK